MDRTVNKTVKVNIFGQEYQIISDGNDEYIINLAKKLDEEMRKYSDDAPMLPAGRIAVLTCLNIMDKFEQYKIKQKESIKKILDRIDNIVNSLEVKRI